MCLCKSVHEPVCDVSIGVCVHDEPVDSVSIGMCVHMNVCACACLYMCVSLCVCKGAQADQGSMHPCLQDCAPLLGSQRWEHSGKEQTNKNGFQVTELQVRRSLLRNTPTNLPHSEDWCAPSPDTGAPVSHARVLAAAGGDGPGR